MQIRSYTISESYKWPVILIMVLITGQVIYLVNLVAGIIKKYT